MAQCSIRNTNVPEPAGALSYETFRADGFEPSEVPCGHLLEGPFNVYVSLYGRLSLSGGADAILKQMGAIADLEGVQYWSISDKRWNTLIEEAYALSGPDDNRGRGDFSAAELRKKNTVYFEQYDNRSSGGVIYRIKLLEAGPDRVLAVVENVTPVKYMIFTIFGVGDIRSVYLFEKQKNNEWDYYNLYGVREEWQKSDDRALKSYVNRAAAMYRHFAGIPTNKNPPAAP